MKKAIFVFAFILFAIMLTLGISAEKDIDSAAFSCPGISSYILEKNTTATLADFSETTLGWDCFEKQFDVSVSEKNGFEPEYPKTGYGMLKVCSKDAKTDEYCFIRRKYQTPLDLGNYSVIFFPICVPYNEKLDYSVELVMISQKGTFTSSCKIQSGVWDTVFCDFSSWDCKNEISEMRIGVKAEGKKLSGEDFLFSVDGLFLSDKNDTFVRARFMSGNYSTFNCDIDYSDGNMVLDVTGQNPYIVTKDISYIDTSLIDSIKICFYCDFTLTSLRTEINGTENVYTVKRGLNTCILPLYGKAEKVKLEFFGARDGQKIKIIDIMPYSEYTTCSLNGTLDECLIDADYSRLTVKGKVNDDVLEKYRGSTVCLFEYPDVAYGAEGSLIDETVLQNTSFKFSHSVRELETCLYRKYAVKIKTNGGYIDIGTYGYVTNPQEISQTNTKQVSVNKKGLTGYSVSELREYGATDTLLRFDIGQFFSPDSNSPQKIKNTDGTFYYNSEYAEKFDRLYRSYSEKGIMVNVIIELTCPENESLRDILVHPDSKGNGNHLAFNTLTSEGMSYLRAAMEYFSGKYCNDGSLHCVICGNELGAGQYDMGQKTLRAFTLEYLPFFRTVYQSVKSTNPGVDVCIYTDSNWNTERSFDEYGKYDSRFLLESFANAVKETGEVNWSLAFDPYPAETTDYFIEQFTKRNSKGEYRDLTFSELETLIEFMSQSNMTYSGFTRSVYIFENTSFSEGTEKDKIAADYVYNYYKSACLQIKLYLTDRKTEREDLLKYIDTDKSESVTEFADEYLRIGDWKDVFPSFDRRKIQTRTVISEKADLGEKKVTGYSTLFDFETDNGFESYASDEKIEAGGELTGRNNILYVSTGGLSGQKAKGVYREFLQPLDLKNAPILRMGMYAASLESAEDKAKMRITLYSGDDTMELDFEIKQAEWTEIYADFSEYEYIDGVTAMSVIMTEGKGTPQFGIDKIEICSSEHDSEALEEILSNSRSGQSFLDRLTLRDAVYPAIVALVCLFFLVIRRNTRYIKRKQEEHITKKRKKEWRV